MFLKKASSGCVMAVCTHEITVALDTWVRPAQDRAHQHFIMDGGEANEIPLFSEVIFSSVLWDGPSVRCECMLITKLFWPMAGQDIGK